MRNDSTKTKIYAQNFLPDPPEAEDSYTWEKYQQELRNQLSLCNEKRNKEFCMYINSAANNF